MLCKNFKVRALQFITLLIFTGSGYSSLSIAAPAAELLPEWQSNVQDSTSSIDHTQWQTVLDSYVVESPTGVNLVDYEALRNDRNHLDSYLTSLGKIDPRNFSKAEQFAYWVNLYNASTVQLIIDNYPTSSIKQIKDGFFSFGPWNRQWINVAGKKLSLNNIEHGILRPIWQDPRIHYAVNCASIGCPNLSNVAFTADNTQTLLDKAASDFINHPRGVNIDLNNLKVNYSSIFDWYQVDFNNSFEGLLNHWQQYADTELAGQIKVLRLEKNLTKDHQYDWQLNDIT